MHGDRLPQSALFFIRPQQQHEKKKITDKKKKTSYTPTGWMYSRCSPVSSRWVRRYAKSKMNMRGITAHGPALETKREDMVERVCTLGTARDPQSSQTKKNNLVSQKQKERSKIAFGNFTQRRHKPGQGQSKQKQPRWASLLPQRSYDKGKKNRN